MVPTETHQNSLLLAALSLGFSRKKRERRRPKHLQEEGTQRKSQTGKLENNPTATPLPHPSESPRQPVQNYQSPTTLGASCTSHPRTETPDSSRQPSPAKVKACLFILLLSPHPPS